MAAMVPLPLRSQVLSFPPAAHRGLWLPWVAAAPHSPSPSPSFLPQHLAPYNSPSFASLPPLCLPCLWPPPLPHPSSPSITSPRWSLFRYFVTPHSIASVAPSLCLLLSPISVFFPFLITLSCSLLLMAPNIGLWLGS